MNVWSGLQYQTLVLSWILKANPKVVGFLYSIHSTVVPVEPRWLAGHYYSMQNPLWGKTIEAFAPPATCKAESKI